MASKNPPKQNAIELLKQDHDRVKELFTEFKRFQESKAEGAEEMKQALMDAVCEELTIHAQVEEELFYPAVCEALPDEKDLVNEALVEHAGAKELIAKIQEGSAEEEMTCAQFLVLGEQIDHHVEEEESELFPKVRKSDMNLETIGKEISARKAELMAQMQGAMPPSGRTQDIWARLSAFGR